MKTPSKSASKPKTFLAWLDKTCEGLVALAHAPLFWIGKPHRSHKAKKATRTTVSKAPAVAITSVRSSVSSKIRKIAVTTAISLMLILVSQLRADSLWMKAGSNTSAHYSDHRAVHAGDILTVLIQETTDIAANKKTKAEKKATISDSITNWFFGSKNHGSLDAAGDSTNTYEGKGDIQDKQAVNASMAVMVTDVLPNGNLLIEGIRALTYSNEKQYMVLQGIVRGDDVTAANTVLSTQIANAVIEIKEEGDLASAQRKGWLMKLNDFIGPF